MLPKDFSKCFRHTLLAVKRVFAGKDTYPLVMKCTPRPTKISVWIHLKNFVLNKKKVFCTVWYYTWCIVPEKERFDFFFRNLLLVLIERGVYSTQRSNRVQKILNWVESFLKYSWKCPRKLLAFQNTTWKEIVASTILFWLKLIASKKALQLMPFDNLVARNIVITLNVICH